MQKHEERTEMEKLKITRNGTRLRLCGAPLLLMACTSPGIKKFQEETSQSQRIDVGHALLIVVCWQCGCSDFQCVGKDEK